MGRFLTNPITIVLLLLIFIIWRLTKRKQIPVVQCSTPLPPEACDPNWLDGVTYRPLLELPTRNCDGRVLRAGEGQCTALTYPDANGQEFAIQIEGADTAAVQDYIKTARAYFLVQRVGRGVSLGPTPDLPSLEVILVEAAMEWSGLSEAELSAMRDELAREYEIEEVSVTLEHVLSRALSNVAAEVPLEPEQVLDDAIAKATEEYRRLGVTAILPQVEIDRIISNIPKEMAALMREPGATFLSDPSSLPIDDAGYRDVLINDPSSLLISLEWASAPKKKSADRWVIWFSIDPSLDRNRKEYYKAKCDVLSASAGVTVTDGKITIEFWRAPLQGSKPDWKWVATADIEDDPSTGTKFHSSSPQERDYDMKLKSGSEGGVYTITGGWEQGSGCE